MSRSQDYPTAKALPEPDAAGYAHPLLTLREAARRFEEHAAMTVSGHKQQHLAEATRLAHQAVIAARMLAAWCNAQAFEVPHG